MKILGLKFSHDAAFALIDDGKLIFSYEMEKLHNFRRYAEFCITTDEVENILLQYGYNFEMIDQIVIDGWSNWNGGPINPASGDNALSFEFKWKGKDVRLTMDDLAGYGHIVKKTDNILRASDFEFREQQFFYKSYLHVAGHIASAYCTSPFSVKAEDSFILVWDGGMPPQLFYYRYKENQVLNLGVLFPVIGYVYINFAHAFKPFNETSYSLSTAGKAMAYMAMGKVNDIILDNYRNIYSDLTDMIGDIEIDKEMVSEVTLQFVKSAQDLAARNNFPHEDMLTTFQGFMQELLLEHLQRKVTEFPGLHANLCIAGGCALNIKWNNSIRNSSIFRDVWVPPFPNDAGSAIGAACNEMMTVNSIRSLEWSVYSGPAISINEKETGKNEIQAHYSARDCNLDELAHILHAYNEPVVFLNERAEMGPRALGNRSILAPAVSLTMKKRLNEMKNREDYRPVAPICLEEYAPSVFTPGTADPYMLFEHHVKENWKDKVPAICHLDGSARLQTINENENNAIYRLLFHYHQLSGIPLLCNTSANFNGRGFFPDVESAMKWNKANLIWSNYVLYIKNESILFEELFNRSVLNLQRSSR